MTRTYIKGVTNGRMWLPRYSKTISCSRACKTGQLKGTIDKWIVLATMARHALYEGTYRKYHEELNLQNTADIYLRIAVDAASQIMEEGGFSLYNTGILK